MADRSRPRWTPALTIGIVLGLLLVLVAILAPLIFGDAASALGTRYRQGPSSGHLLGTDELGRDVLARALVATRLTLIMALGATAIAVIAGVLLGGIVWLFPPVPREVVLRVIDATVAFPPLILALVVAAILGPGSLSALTAIGIAGIPGFARLTTNMVGAVVHREFVTTARLLGVSEFSLFTRHLLPNIAGPLLVLITGSFSLSLLELASLSFVGLGVQSPQYDYGKLLGDGLTVIYNQPWQATAPSVMLVYAGVAAMLIGDGIAARLGGASRRTPRITAPDTTAGQAVAAAPDALLEVADLHIHAPDGTRLVNGVSFTIGEGEVVGIVGESGSGKSMTAMAIAGLSPDGVTARAKTIRLGDLDLTAGPSRRRLAREIGLVYQDPGTTFNPALRIGPQLTEVARLHLGMGRRAATSLLVQGLDRMQVRAPETRMRQHAQQLSGGMLQRAVIASALATEPRLIIADEPTTALDVTVQAEVLRQLRLANEERGTAILFISHDLGVVEQLCDTVLVMKHGEIVERLARAELSAGEVRHPYTRMLLDSSPRIVVPTPAVGEGGSR